MGRGQIQPTPVEREAVARIVDAAAQLGVSGRELAARTGIGRERVRCILAGGIYCTLGEFEAMCDALDLTGWRVLYEVETGEEAPEAPEAALATVTSLPGYGEDVARADLPTSYAALDLGVDPEVEAEQMAQMP